jgi:Tol biopolymer transport system component
MNSSAIWSPDGGRLLFRANRQGSVVELFQQSADGGGQIQPMLTYTHARSSGIRTIAHVPTDWSPDGQNVLLSVPSAATGFDIWLLPAAGSGNPSPLIEGDGDQMHGNFSPDGRFVAYASNESGRFEVYVQTFPPTERKWQVSTTGGTEPRWRSDGEEIYYLSPEEKLIAVTVKAGPSFAVPRTLFQTQVAAQSSVFRTHYVAANRGQRFLVNPQTGEGSGTAITVLLNWTAGLKR